MTAVRVLLYLAIAKRDTPVAAAELAEMLGQSPTYVAKVTTQLVKAGLLKARKGAKGGLVLGVSPPAITLRRVYEVFQGRPVDVACTDGAQARLVCGFHRAMIDLENSVFEAMERWTLADLAERPQPAPSLRDRVSCRLQGLQGP